MLSWFESRLNPYPAHEPERPPTGLVAFCLHFSMSAKRWLALMAITAAAIAVFEILMFSFLGNIVDWLSTANKQTFFADQASTLIVMGLLLLLVYPALLAVSSLTIHQTLLGNFPQRIRWLTHRYLLRQSMSYFQDEFAGRIATKLLQTSLAVREVMMKLLDVVVFVAVYFLGTVVFAFLNDWRFALPFVLWLLIYGGLIAYFVPRQARVAQQQADARSLMTGRIVDSYTNISTVKLFSHAKREEAYAHEALDGFLKTVYRQMRLGTRFDISITVLNMSGLCVVSLTGLYLWTIEEITAGAVAAAIALILRFNSMSHWIMWELSGLFENIGTVRDGMNSLALPRLVKDLPNAKILDDVRGAVRFENVHFQYDRGVEKSESDDIENDRGADVIDHLNLNIQPGEKIGLVGRSGAGKSTIVNLLLRFYDLNSGAITIDGINIAEVTQESLRGNIGVVTQDTSLLHRSVRDNITYGRPDASDAEMIKAAQLAEAHDFIGDLADANGRRGYDAHVGERGVKLSGGQRQRIAIARVLLKDAPILVLDEATSALDSEVEAAIQSQLELLMESKTVIAIAHRLSTIAAMDRLIVFGKGKIIEQGTHAELLALDGHYARLWRRQSGGFLNLDEVAADA